MKPINKQKLLCAFLALGVLSAAACVLNACKEKEPSPIKLVYDKEQQKLTDEENGIVYRFASISYEPMEYRTAPYAMWGDALTFYEVVGWDAKKLLTEEFSGIGGMIYAEDSPLPTLDQMEATEIHICQKTTHCCLKNAPKSKTKSPYISWLPWKEAALISLQGGMGHIRICMKKKISSRFLNIPSTIGTDNVSCPILP